MKQILYFAYGSNLLSSRLRFRIGSANFVQNYRLPDYELVFNCNQYANIISSKGSYVDGTLYSITAEQLSILNRYEALYNAHFFEFKDYIVAVYIGKDHVTEYNSIHDLPTREYISIIIEGAAEKGLSTLYNRLVDLKERIPKPIPRSFLRGTSKKKKLKRRR